MRYYVSAAGLARLADEMVAVALVLLALRRTGSEAVAGALITAYTLPTLVSGPLLGAWLDRTRRRRAALVANLAVLSGSAVGLVAVLGRAPVVVPLGLAAAAGVTLPMTSAGYSSLLPRLLRPGRLARGYVVDATTFSVAAIGGPALAGGVAAVAGPAAATLTLAGVAVAGLLATAALRVPAGAPAPAAAPATPGGVGGLADNVRTGLRHMVREPVLRGATLTTALRTGAVGVMAVGMPLYAGHLGARDSLAGLLWAVLEAGSLLGTLAVTRLGRRWTPQAMVVAGTALFGAVMAAWPLARSVGAAVPLVALAGVVAGPLLPAILLVRQRHTPPDLLAQISTTGASLKIGAYALGAALGGLLAPRLGATATVAVVASAHLAAASLGWLAGARGARSVAGARASRAVVGARGSGAVVGARATDPADPRSGVRPQEAPALAGDVPAVG